MELELPTAYLQAWAGVVIRWYLHHHRGSQAAAMFLSGPASCEGLRELCRMESARSNQVVLGIAIRLDQMLELIILIAMIIVKDFEGEFFSCLILTTELDLFL